MSLKSLRRICLSVVMVCATGIVEGEEGPAATAEVVAQGMGAVVGGDQAAARKAAINDALRIAVEMKMGVHVKSSRVAEMYLLKRDRIEARSEGVIDSYKVEDEKAIGPIYWVKISAKFRADAVKEKGLDQVQVALVTKATGKTNDIDDTSSDLEMAVQQGLTEAGLRVVPAPSSVDFGTSFEEQARAAKEASIDLLISVQATTEKKDNFGGLLLCRSTADLKVTKPYTKEMLVSRRFRAMGKRKTDLGDAAATSVTKVGKEVVDYLVKQMLRKTTGLIESRVFLFGVEDRWQIDAVRKALFQRKGIRNVELKYFAENTAVLLVQLSIKDKEELGEYLTKVKDLKIAVQEQAPGWVQALIKKDED